MSARLNMQRAVVLALSCAARMGRRGSGGVVLGCPPVPEANRGDQALLLASVQELQRRGVRPLHLVQTSRHPILNLQPAPDLVIHDRFAPIFESPWCFREQTAWLRFLHDKDALALVGCDVLDEGYSVARSEGSLLAMRLAARAGVPSRVVGFSINDTSSPALYDRFDAFVRAGGELFVRDEVSLQRLLQGGVAHAQLTADLALLVEPAPLEEVDPELRRFFDRFAGRVVGLNFTDVVVGARQAAGAGRDAFFDRITRACVTLARTDGVGVLCLPHDEQGGVEFLAALHERLRAALPHATARVHPLPSARVLKRIAGMCQHVFTCRLHLGIAALGMGAAVTGFPYQGKFEGQFRHFGLSDCLIPLPELPSDATLLAALLRRRLALSHELSRRIREKLPAVLAQSRSNFQGLGHEPSLPAHAPREAAA